MEYPNKILVKWIKTYTTETRGGGRLSSHLWDNSWQSKYADTYQETEFEGIILEPCPIEGSSPHSLNCLFQNLRPELWVGFKKYKTYLTESQFDFMISLMNKEEEEGILEIEIPIDTFKFYPEYESIGGKIRVYSEKGYRNVKYGFSFFEFHGIEEPEYEPTSEVQYRYSRVFEEAYSKMKKERMEPVIESKVKWESLKDRVYDLLGIPQKNRYPHHEEYVNKQIQIRQKQQEVQEREPDLSNNPFVGMILK